MKAKEVTEIEQENIMLTVTGNHSPIRLIAQNADLKYLVYRIWKFTKWKPCKLNVIHELSDDTESRMEFCQT